MSDVFDPYHKWLAIPPDEQPPNHYRLLGVRRFEDDPDVIEAAADQRMAHLRTYQLGQCSELSQRLLNEVAAAKVCLLNPERKSAYDEQLRRDSFSAPVVLGPTVRRREQQSWLVPAVIAVGLVCLGVVAIMSVGNREEVVEVSAKRPRSKPAPSSPPVPRKVAAPAPKPSASVSTPKSEIVIPSPPPPVKPPPVKLAPNGSWTVRR